MSRLFFEVKDLSVTYGNSIALKGISIWVGKGEIITLIGANGAGKTTTLRALSRLIPWSSGEIWFQNMNIDGMPPQDVVKLGIVHIPEGRRLFADMTVVDNIKMGAYLRKDNHGIESDLESMYRHFPILKRRCRQRAGSLSGGEQQMLAIARALMAKPKVLLMDEPSLGLSPILVDEIGRIIKDINGSGVSIILVEQNALVALELANRAYVLEIGSIVMEGDAKKVANNEEVKKAYLGI